nr:MAG TPA: hypothetical protein [Caudoviricetes sp.]
MTFVAISYAKSYVRYAVSFSLTLFILELNYCILLVQGRYSSVLWFESVSHRQRIQMRLHYSE